MEAVSSAQQSEITSREALARRSSYYVDLARLCGVDEREEINELMTTLKVLMDQESRLREVSSALLAGEYARAATVMEEACVTEQSIPDEIETLDTVSRHVQGGLRRRVYEGTNPLTSQAVVNRVLLADTTKKVRLSKPTMYRFKFDSEYMDFA